VKAQNAVGGSYYAFYGQHELKSVVPPWTHL